MGRARQGGRRHRGGGRVHAHRGDASVQEGHVLTDASTIYTIGHGARPVEHLIEELTAAGVKRLVDVRTAPGSRRHPQFGREALREALAAAGIAYEWRKDLGGFRKPRPDSPNVALRNESFRGYADYMQTPEFAGALDWLVGSSAGQRTAVMCAETLWWRCHRRMIADALVTRGIPIAHLIGSKEQPHQLHPEARVTGQAIVYDRGGAVQVELVT